MAQLVKRSNTLPAEEWKWRDRKAKFHLPRDMETRYMMNVVLMIWDNTVPQQMWTRKDAIIYNFGPYYTPEYMRRAIRFMFTELDGRDLSAVPAWVKRRWNIMRSWLTQPEFAAMYEIGETRKLTHV